MALDPRRIGVLVSGEGTNLGALLERVHGTDGCRIVAVAASKPGIAALERSAAAGVESAVFAKADHPSREERDGTLAGWLAERDVGLVVTAGWMELLTGTLLDRFPNRVVNVHPSLLPEFPGIDAVGQAVAAGVTRTGVTVHLVDAGVDTGRVLVQEGVDLPPGITAAEAAELLRPVEHRLLPEAVLALSRRAGYIGFGE
ncbi:MAG: phosphoribosylglycinamide formyltransferase [Actinomycetes bacterium]